LRKFPHGSAAGEGLAAGDWKTAGVVLDVRQYVESDVEWAEGLIGGFAGRRQARLGSLIDVLGCAGLVAAAGDERVGILTYVPERDGAEIAYLEAARRSVGVGTALLSAVVDHLQPARLWLVTTNDNLDALRFYQRRGFRVAGVHCGAVDAARRDLKPTISEVGEYGIPLRDEMVMEWRAGWR
jgi:ribosomal protein S18 acetylase RimI-like enzyme